MENIKKKDRILLISALISVGIVIIVLAIAFLFPIFEAKLMLSKTEKAFGSFSDGDTLLIADPLFGGEGIPEPAEAALDFESGADIASRLAEILGGAKYSETKKTVLGSWGMSVSARGEGDVFTVYFSDGGFYLADGQKQYYFTPKEDMSEEYSDFIGKLEDILTRSAEN